MTVCSHLGRPKGEDPAFSLRPVTERLQELLPDDRLRVLENTRFNPGETKNDPRFAQELADGNDLFVQDASGRCTGRHASTVGVPQLLPATWSPARTRADRARQAPRRGGAALRPHFGRAKVQDKSAC